LHLVFAPILFLTQTSKTLSVLFLLQHFYANAILGLALQGTGRFTKKEYKSRKYPIG
tara:strand:- start:804 stop:974 length:171 start_codon:yes stop_codon:yes gene_type:complete